MIASNPRFDTPDSSFRKYTRSNQFAAYYVVSITLQNPKSTFDFWILCLCGLQGSGVYYIREFTVYNDGGSDSSLLSDATPMLLVFPLKNGVRKLTFIRSLWWCGPHGRTTHSHISATEACFLYGSFREPEVVSEESTNLGLACTFGFLHGSFREPEAVSELARKHLNWHALRKYWLCLMQSNCFW